LAKSHHLKVEKWHEKGHILDLFFEKYAEKHLIQPTFLMDHPIEISFLTKSKPDKPGYTERFELFIVGREFANAYSELNDPSTSGRALSIKNPCARQVTKKPAKLMRTLSLRWSTACRLRAGLALACAGS